MKIAVGEIRLSNRPLLYSNADSGHRFWARRHLSHAIVAGDTPSTATTSQVQSPREVQAARRS